MDDSRPSRVGACSHTGDQRRRAGTDIAAHGDEHGLFYRNKPAARKRDQNTRDRRGTLQEPREHHADEKEQERIIDG